MDENGIVRQGALQSSKTIKTHRMVDLLNTETDQEREARILVSAAFSDASTGLDSLPERDVFEDTGVEVSCPSSSWKIYR